jgi:uncharacterized membrane protein YhaH (DUF805 family)
MRWIRFALAFAAVATAYFYHLDRPLLWGDEAHTGVVARSILRSGLPSAFDGRNVTLYDDGAQLNRQLLYKQVPWVQWYVGALSLALFGDTTAGLRVLFALAGLLAYLPLWAVLARRVKHPEIVAALALIAPQAVLFQRNARYYPILILLYACLVWHLSKDFKNGKVRFATACVIFVLLFHTHPFAAVCTAAALLLFCLYCRRPDLPGYLAAAGLGFVSWIAWDKALGPPLISSPLFQTGAVFPDLGAWCGAFLHSLLATVVDLDAVGSLPLLLLSAAGAVLFVCNRKDLIGLCREPLFGLTLIGILVQAAASAAVFGTETASKFALLRYLPHLAVFATVACFVALDKAVSAAAPFLGLCAAAVACNFATFSHWAAPFGRQVPASWTGAVYSEIFNPATGAWDDVIAKLRHAGAARRGVERTIIALPPWTQSMIVFYLGDDYFVPPESVIRSSMGPRAGRTDSPLRQALGDIAYRRLCARPEWIVDSLNWLDRAPRGFATAAFVASFRTRPDDGTRPELTRHTFSQHEPVAGIVLYRLQDD